MKRSISLETLVFLIMVIKTNTIFSCVPARVSQFIVLYFSFSFFFETVLYFSNIWSTVLIFTLFYNYVLCLT